MKMQSLFMMMPAHIFNRDARVSLQGWRCKFLVVQVPSNGHVMKQMLLVGMSWCKCPIGACYDANARLGMQWMQMFPWEYAMMQNTLLQTQFIKKFLLFSKRGFHNAWNQNIFTLDLLFMKSHLLFDLRLPKNWWLLLENLWMGHLLEIWWSGSKDLFPQFG